VRDYTYRVTGFRIVEPTEVSVMEATVRPTLTLVSCYPYLVDTQRIVVFAELAEG
jgi:sortase A